MAMIRETASNRLRLQSYEGRTPELERVFLLQLANLALEGALSDDYDVTMTAVDVIAYATTEHQGSRNPAKPSSSRRAA